MMSGPKKDPSAMASGDDFRCSVQPGGKGSASATAQQIVSVGKCDSHCTIGGLGREVRHPLHNRQPL